MEKQYTQLVILYYVAYFMSFTKAAKQLNCSKAYISKQVSELERTIGSALFYRNTRTIRLTLAGESLFEHAALIVREYQSVENTIASLQHKAQGVLRLTAPSAYADCILAPHLPLFLAQYPKITLEMNFTGQLLNLVDQKIDVAIRLTHEPPLDRVAKRIGDYQQVICAAPGYLQKNHEIKTPKQLSELECLTYSPDKNSQHWPFVVDGQAITVNVHSKIATNSSEVLLKAVIAGLGIARLPSYVADEAIKQQLLQPILNEFYPIPIPIYAIYAQSRIIPPQIHAFIEFIHGIHQK